MTNLLSIGLGFIAMGLIAKFSNHLIIEPIFNWALKHNRKFSNKLYKQAAKQNTSNLMLALYSLVYLFVLIISLYTIIDMFSQEVTSALTSSNETVNEFTGYIGMGLVITEIVLLNIFGFFIFIRHVIIYDLVIDYCHKLKIINPILTEKESLEIQQEWALIESVDDYNKIKDKMNFLVKKAKEKRLESLNENITVSETNGVAV